MRRVLRHAPNPEMTALAAAVRLLVAALLGAAPRLRRARHPWRRRSAGAPASTFATGARADRGQPIGRLRCTAPAGGWADAHLEVFARGRVVIVPPGVGIARPRLRVGAAVRGGRCSYPVRTTDPTGVIRYRPGRGLELGDVFAVWGQPLTRTSAVRLPLGGRGARLRRRQALWRGAPRRCRCGGTTRSWSRSDRVVPPHATYLFVDGKAATA